MKIKKESRIPGYDKFELIQYVSSTLLAISYLPQIIKILCTHNVTSQSLWFWIILSIGLVGIDINAFHIMKSTKKKAFFIGQTVNALLGITILIQVLVYM